MFNFNFNKIYQIEIEPISYVRRTKADSWKKRPAVVKYYAYKNLLAFLLNRMGYKQEEKLNIIFYLPIPKSFRNREIYHLKEHHKKPDLDNLVKAFLDAVAKQDNYICQINATKLYSLSPQIIVLQ